MWLMGLMGEDKTGLGDHKRGKRLCKNAKSIYHIIHSCEEECNDFYLLEFLVCFGNHKIKKLVAKYNIIVQKDKKQVLTIWLFGGNICEV